MVGVMTKKLWQCHDIIYTVLQMYCKWKKGYSKNPHSYQSHNSTPNQILVLSFHLLNFFIVLIFNIIPLPPQSFHYTDPGILKHILSSSNCCVLCANVSSPPPLISSFPSWQSHWVNCCCYVFCIWTTDQIHISFISLSLLYCPLLLISLTL